MDKALIALCDEQKAALVDNQGPSALNRNLAPDTHRVKNHVFSINIEAFIIAL